MRGNAIEMEGVSVRYRLALERPQTFQEYIISRLRGKKYQYEDFWALKDVDVIVRSGENTGIIGPNGAGKSTLLKVVAGVLKPSTGRVTVRGRVAPLIELGAGFDMDLTGEENIYLNASILGLSRREIRAAFDSIVTFSELENFIYTPLRTYSSGMVARLAFSIAAQVKADILIMDEVLSVGDEGFKRKCRDRIDESIKAGATLLFVSHSMQEVQKICDLAVWIEKGRVLTSGDVDSVSRRYLLRFDGTAFEDIPEGHPYKRYVDALFLRGITMGYTVDGKRYYNPENRVSRAEFAVFLGRSLGSGKAGASRRIYADVPETHWASPQITWLHERGWLKDVKDEKGRSHFFPDDYVDLRDVREMLSAIKPERSVDLPLEEGGVIDRGKIARILCDFFDLSDVGR